MTPSIQYLNPADVIEKRQSEAPRNRRADGYGNKIATSWELRLKDKRWRRVYVICWSNSGSAYVLVHGDLLFLGAYDPQD